MRIVGGSRKGAKLAEVGRSRAASSPAPTSDRAREAIFNLIAHKGLAEPAPPIGMRVLDLFAGTGALGLEALSRGAAEAVFVETGRPALALLRQNLARLAPGATVIAADATRLGRCPMPPFDLVFLDPPYGRGLGELALAAALAGGWLAPGAIVIWEEGAAVAPPAGLTLLDARRYGAATVSILRA